MASCLGNTFGALAAFEQNAVATIDIMVIEERRLHISVRKPDFREKKMANTEIRSIRQRACMTQAVFAEYFGVSTKTIEAWERGKTHPTGPACRLLDILAAGKEHELSFVQII